MEPSQFISSMPVDRQSLLTRLHGIITSKDPRVVAVVKPMMGKEMILYEERGYMKYGLASTKNYMSLHCLPMYMNPSLHAKYEALLSAAKFQKGCINFTNQSELPAATITALITECSAISIADMLEKRKKK